MAKVWVLDSETKGTGAHMVPLDDVLAKPEPGAKPAKRRPPRREAARPDGGARPGRSAPRPPAERTSTALPAGHVRKKSTGELGKVRSIDAHAGTATVHWLKHGHTSTVPLTTVTRR
jgi:hypothetical protein